MPANSKPLTRGFFGAKGTGKTTGAKRLIQRERPARLAVWDFKHDPSLRDVGRPFTDLGAAIRAMAAARFQVRYLVDHDGDIDAQFDRFCRACYIAGDLTAYVCEVGEVSKPGRTAKAWRKLVNVGREYQRADGRDVGVAIIVDGQRTAEMDKAIIANLDVVRAGRMGHDDDARALAKRIGCDWRELMTLPDLEYFERDVSQPAATRGRITFAKKNQGQGRAL